MENNMRGKIQVELQAIYGTDRDIAESAWTSSLDKAKKEARTDEDIKRIVEMLADKGHSVPFESINFRFWIRMPIFVDRQFQTHRIQSSSGLSGRYRTMPDDYFSIPEDVSAILRKAGCEEAEEEYFDACESAYNGYMASLFSLKNAEKDKFITNDEFKRAREILRGQLPVCGMTERTTVMNLRSFANFYKLRSKSDAQPEIQLVAKLMLEAIKASGKIPVALESLEKNSWQI